MSLVSISEKISHLRFTYTYTAHQHREKVSKIFHKLFLYLPISAIMNLIFHTARLGNFMTSYRNKFLSCFSPHYEQYNEVNFSDHLICRHIFQRSPSETEKLLTSKNPAWNHILLNRQNQRF